MNASKLIASYPTMASFMKPGHQMIRPVCIMATLWMAGCSTPTTESFDGEANYRHVFKDLRSPMPRVVQSRVERDDRRLFGIRMSPTNGEWEFEIIAPSNWVSEVKVGFVPTSFATVPKRDLPSWFCPKEEDFEIFHLQHSSYPAAHLYVERKPKDPQRIRAFIRRH